MSRPLNTFVDKHLGMSDGNREERLPNQEKPEFAFIPADDRSNRHRAGIPGWSFNISRSGLCFRCRMELPETKPLIRFLKGESDDFAEYEIRNSTELDAGVWEYNAVLRREGHLSEPDLLRGLTYRLSDIEFNELLALAGPDSPAGACERRLETVSPASSPPRLSRPGARPSTDSDDAPASPHTANAARNRHQARSSQASCLWAMISVGTACILSTGHIWGATSITRYSSFAVAVGSIATIEWIRTKLREHRCHEFAIRDAVKGSAGARPGLERRSPR